VYCYDEADRLIVGGAISSVSYDDHGNTTELNGQSYQYDAADRVVAINKGQASETYVRDPLGRVIGQASNGVTNRMRYSGLGDQVAFSVDQANNVTQRRLALPGGAELIATGITKNWAYSNLHGDTVSLTDAAGWLVDGEYMLDPWGQGPVAAVQLPGPPTGVGLGFLGAAGKQTDMTTGLDPTVQLGARTYNPALGRFLSVDPVVGGCANDYVYVKGDPLNHNDPDGRFCWKSWIGVGIGLLGLAAAVAAPFTGGGSLGVWLTWAGVVAGGVAVGLDIQPCAAGDEVACGAIAVGGVAFGLGLLAPFLPAMGLLTVGEQAGFAGAVGSFSVIGAGLDSLAAAGKSGC